MKHLKLLVFALVGIALVATPVFAKEVYLVAKEYTKLIPAIAPLLANPKVAARCCTRESAMGTTCTRLTRGFVSCLPGHQVLIGSSPT